MKSDLLEIDPVIRYLSKQETGAVQAYVTDVINHAIVATDMTFVS